MLEILFAVLPFVLTAYLLLVHDIRADVVMGLVLLMTLAFLVFGLSASLRELLAPLLSGALLAVDVILIISGVLLIFCLLEQTRALSHLEDFFMRMTSEAHVHVIVMGFLLVFFLEGIAGFGMPALIVAPLLVLVGVRKLTAIVVTLFADSLAVVFGAFGTPFLVGFGEYSYFQASQLVGLVNGLLLVLAPAALLVIFAWLEREPVSSIRPFLGLSLLTGVLSAAVFIATSMLLGPELPSVLTPLVVLPAVLLVLRAGWLGVRIRIPSARKALPAIGAYGLVVAVLLVSRLDLFAAGEFLRSLSVEVSLGAAARSFSAYHPGVLLLACFALLLVVMRPGREVVRSAVVAASRKAGRVVLTLLFTLMFVQVLVFSGAPMIIANALAGSGSAYVFFASVLGAFGSFIAGSATVSNVLFVPLHADAALLNGLPQYAVFAAQSIGAGAGNIIAIHNVLAVLAVVHLRSGLRRVLRVNIVLAAGLCLLGSLLVFVLA